MPAQAERNGNFNAEGVTVRDPTTGLPFANNIIPAQRISSVALGFLALYPLPNAGDLSRANSANYIDNRANDYTSDQYDIRVDHYLTSKQSVLGPGTVTLNAGLAKYFSITERLRIKIEGSFTNVLNHVDVADPALAIDSNSVGQVTAAQGADFGAYRTGQVGARVEF